MIRRIIERTESNRRGRRWTGHVASADGESAQKAISIISETQRHA